MRSHVRWTLVALLATAGSARAATFEATSLTLVQGRAEPNEGEEKTVVPIIEEVGLSASSLGNPLVDDLALDVRAWGRADPFQPSGRLGNAADLDLAYLSGNVLNRKLGLKLGRHLVVGGVARVTQLDGLSFDWNAVSKLHLTAFGGLPVIPRFAVARGDAVAGARVFWRQSINAEAGASFIQVFDHGDTARQDAGVDARYVIVPGLTVQGQGMWSLVEARISEADLGVQYQLTPDIELSADARRTAPDLFLSRTSIFSVFAAEDRDELGGGVFWRPIRRLRLWGDYHFFRLDPNERDLDAELGHDGQVRASWSVATGSTVGAQARLFRAPLNGYLQGRLYGMQRVGSSLTLTLDLDAYRFQDPVNGQPHSYVAAGTAAWNFAPDWMAAVSGLGSVTPFFERRFEVVAKLVYNFSTRVREVQP